MTWSVGAGLEGRGVIVTGAAGGIGKAVAEAFAMTGARVLAVDLEQRAVDDVVAGLEGSGHVAAAADLRDLASHALLVERARRELGGLYVLADLAAVLRRRNSVVEVTEEDWDVQHDINLKATFFLVARSRRPLSRPVAAVASSCSPHRAGGRVASAARWCTPRPRAA